MPLTIGKDSVFEFTEKKSEFIGHAFFTPDEESARAAIEKIRALHPQATHNVFAYKIRTSGVSRSSDDGEPQGTAGTPVLKVIDLNNVTDITIVVTRYFGGILLGAGGLVRAYTKAAAGAVEAAGKAEIITVKSFKVSFAYPIHNSVVRVLERYGAEISDKIFTDSVTVCASLEKEIFKALAEELESTYYTNITVADTGEVLSRRPV